MTGDIRTLMESINSILNESMGTPMSFQDLCKVDDLGIVIHGAGGEISEWAEGIAKMLAEEGISATENVFSSYGVVTGNVMGNKGRTDAYLIFNPENKIDMGKLAIWRLRFGDASWIEDFCHNYAKDYVEGHQGDQYDDGRNLALQGDDDE